MTTANLLDYAPALGGALAVAGSALVHGYVLIVKAGGVRGIWRQFLNGADKPPAP